MKFNKNITLDFFNFLNQKKGVRAPYYVKRALGVPLEPEDNVIDGDLDLGISSREEKLNVPDGMVVNGDFYFRRLMSVDILPKNLTVKGAFRVSENSTIEELPKNLTVYGDFRIPSSVKRIEDDVTLKGNVFAYDYNKLQKLPNNLNVQQLSLHKCPNLTHLPENLRVETDCYISKTSITHIPDNTYIGDSLTIEESPLTSIGNGIKIKNTLFLRNISSIEKIGNNIEIGKYLDLRESNVNETNFRDIIPRDIKVESIFITPKDKEKIFDTKGGLYLSDYGVQLLSILTKGYSNLKYSRIGFVQ